MSIFVSACWFYPSVASGITRKKNENYQIMISVHGSLMEDRLYYQSHMIDHGTIKYNLKPNFRYIFKDFIDDYILHDEIHKHYIW